MKLEARHLEHLAAIVDHGTMQQAAEYLGTSQPALSRMLRQMEDRTGILLFEPGSRPLLATEMGRKLSDQGRAIKAARARAHEDVMLSARGMIGELKIGAPPFLCERLVGDVIATFYGKRPAIEAQLVSDYFPSLERALLLNQVEIIVCPIKLVVAGQVALQVESLFRDEHVVVARREHALTRKSSITIEDLEAASWIGHARRSMLNTDMATALASIGVVNLKIGFHSESAGANFEMLRRTDFLTVLPRYALSQIQIDSGLTVLPVKFSTPFLAVGMVTSKERTASPLLKAFQEHLRHYVGESDLISA